MKTKSLATYIGKAIAVAAIALTTHQAMGQDKQEQLTNQSVVDLTKAGLDKSIILTTIQNADVKFDMSATGLIALKKANVDDDIIAAMVARSNGTHSTGTNATATSAASGDYSLLNNPYYQGKPLEKVLGGVRQKVRMLGYGGANVQVELQGERSSIRIPSDASINFVINTGNAAPELALYKAEVNKGKRIAIAAKARMFDGVKEGENTLSFNVSTLGNGIYQLTPSGALEAGEYLFVAKNITGVTVDTYGFGID